MKYLCLVCFIAYVICLARLALGETTDLKSESGDFPYTHNSSASLAPVLLAANSGGVDLASWSSYYTKSESKLDGVLLKCYECINAQGKQNAKCEGATLHLFYYSFFHYLTFCSVFFPTRRVQQYDRPQ